MPNTELHETAAALVAEGKGILAADESAGTIKKRFETIGVESTEENRRAYRELLFTTPGAEEYISGVILYDETIRQKADDGTPFPELLASKGIIPGIKVDDGAKPLARADGRDGDRGARRAAPAARGVPRAGRALRQVARGLTRSRTRCRASTASGRTPTRSPATPRSARRPRSSPSSSPRCCRTGRTPSSAANWSPLACSRPSSPSCSTSGSTSRARCSSRTWSSPATRRPTAPASTRSPRRRCTCCYEARARGGAGIVFLSGGPVGRGRDRAPRRDERARAARRGSSPFPTAAPCRRRRSTPGAARRRTSRPASAPTTTAQDERRRAHRRRTRPRWSAKRSASENEADRRGTRDGSALRRGHRPPVLRCVSPRRQRGGSLRASSLLHAVPRARARPRRPHRALGTHLARESRLGTSARL